MKLIVSAGLLQKYPELKLGVVTATNTDNRGDDAEIAHMLQEIQESIKMKFNTNNLTEHPAIAIWRKTYSSFGSKPRDYRCSIEALIRSILNGRPLRHINKIVDLYNFVSLKHVIPVGGEDLDKVEGNLNLTFAEGNEKFISLGSDKEENPYPGEVIYCDDAGNVLCRRWNWRESDKTKLTEKTRNAIIVVEGLDTTIEKVIEEMSLLLEKFCNCKIQSFVLDRENTEIEW